MKYFYFLINVLKIKKQQLRKEKENHCYISCIYFSMLLLFCVILSIIYLKKFYDISKTAGKVID